MPSLPTLEENAERRLTTKLSDAGGPARPHCQPTWPALVRSSDLVRRSHLTIGGRDGNRTHIATAINPSGAGSSCPMIGKTYPAKVLNSKSHNPTLATWPGRIGGREIKTSDRKSKRLNSSHI